MMLIGAKAHFCAGHRLPQHEATHGHSYEVWAFAKEGDCAEQLQSILSKICSILDHRMLNDIIDPPTMENIARYIAGKMPVKIVRVVRPVEGLCSEYQVAD